MPLRFEYAPGATPIDPDEAAELIPVHLTLQRELDEYEEANFLEATEWAFARRRGDPLDSRFVHAVHRRMFNRVWRWAGRARRSDKNLGAPWIEIPTRLHQMLPFLSFPKDARSGSRIADPCAGVPTSPTADHQATADPCNSRTLKLESEEIDWGQGGQRRSDLQR